MDVLIIKCVGIFALTSFIPLTALSYYFVALPKKKEDYASILKALNIEGAGATLTLPSMKNEYDVKDYLLPVSFATLLCLLGSIALLLGHELKVADQYNLIFSGIQPDTPDGADKVYQEKSLSVIAMAFIGAYLWSVQNIFRRLNTIDLPPIAYYAVGIRMVLACFVALMIRYSWGLFGAAPDITDSAALAAEAGGDALLPVIAFLTGMFPERALQWLEDKISIFSRKRTTQRADDLPLDMIEGVNIFHKIRLNEIGIDNAQNLAEANLVDLLLRTPYKPKRVIDWIGQAKLYTFFKNDVSELKKFGIRTIFDFIENAKQDGKLPQLADATGIHELVLTNVYSVTQNDKTLDNIKYAGEALRVI